MSSKEREYHIVMVTKTGFYEAMIFRQNFFFQGQLSVIIPSYPTLPSFKHTTIALELQSLIQKKYRYSIYIGRDIAFRLT